MSMFDYLQSLDLGKDDPSFVALIMAAMRKADSCNIMVLRNGFPQIWKELSLRYHAPGGYLPEEIPSEITGKKATLIIIDDLDEPKKDPDEPDRKFCEDEHER